jgi:chromosome segregation ATPase
MKEGKCIMGEMRKDREGGLPNDVDGLIDHYRHEVRKGQEAYDQLLKELNMLRGTKVIVESLSTKNKRLQDEIDRIKKENNDLYNRIADALGVNESHQKLNGKLQERLTELEEENKKLHEHVDRQVSGARQSGM